MNKILTIMWKDVNVLFRDWATVALIIAGPLVLALGLGLVTGGFGPADAPTIGRISVLVVDQDGGQFASALTDLFSADELSDLVAPELVLSLIHISSAAGRGCVESRPQRTPAPQRCHPARPPASPAPP